MVRPVKAVCRRRGAETTERGHVIPVKDFIGRIVGWKDCPDCGGLGFYYQVPKVRKAMKEEQDEFGKLSEGVEQSGMLTSPESFDTYVKRMESQLDQLRVIETPTYSPQYASDYSQQDSVTRKAVLPQSMEEIQNWIGKNNLSKLKEDRVQLEIEQTEEKLEDVRKRKRDLRQGRIMNALSAPKDTVGFDALRRLSNSESDVRDLALKTMNDPEFPKPQGNITVGMMVQWATFHAKLFLKKPITEDDRAAYYAMGSKSAFKTFIKNHPKFKAD